MGVESRSKAIRRVVRRWKDAGVKPAYFKIVFAVPSVDPAHFRRALHLVGLEEDTQ